MILKILKWLLSYLFHWNKSGLSLPYPEEQIDYTKTLENTLLEPIQDDFIDNYRVPIQYWDFWKNEVATELTLKGSGTISQIKKVSLNVAGANQGQLAHEYSHISYYLLTPQQKTDFALAFAKAQKEDKLLNYLYNLPVRWYMRSNVIEGHAEMYRFLGDKMPEELQQFYPKLLV